MASRCCQSPCNTCQRCKEELQELNERLKAQNAKKEEHMRAAQRRAKDLETKLNSKEDQHSTALEDKRHLENENRELRAQVSRMAAMESELRELKKTLADKEREIADMRDKNQDEYRKLKDIIQALEMEIQAYRRILDSEDEKLRYPPWQSSCGRSSKTPERLSMRPGPSNKRKTIGDTDEDAYEDGEGPCDGMGDARQPTPRPRPVVCCTCGQPKDKASTCQKTVTGFMLPEASTSNVFIALSGNGRGSSCLGGNLLPRSCH